MESRNKKRFPNLTAKFFYKLCLICYCSGLPDVWIKPLPFPKKFDILHGKLSFILTVLMYILVLAEEASILTQEKLTPKQKTNQAVFMISHPLLFSYSISFTNHAEKIKKVIADILKLKEVHNNGEIEEKMLKKSKLYSSVFSGTCMIAMLMFTFNCSMEVIRGEGTFSTVITVYPLTEDNSVLANFVRLISNLLWWAMIARVISVYAFVFTLTSCMSHQYTDLQSYFRSLEHIFQDPTLSQRQKERKYEAKYIIGIQLHFDTLQCVELSKNICNWLFSGQIIYNVSVLVILMAEFEKAKGDMMQAAALGFGSCGTLLGTGLFMCNAGDISVEASDLCTAMYFSGWQNCQGQSSVRVRKLLMTSMIYAQRPVEIKGVGVISLSYGSFVSIVKSTYSLFSLVLQKTQAQ